MTALNTVFAAERIKWRKSWILVTAVLAPICQVAFLGLLFWFSESRVRMVKPGSRFWVEVNFVIWNLLVMPISTALLCELSWDQEREARAWNRLLVQPHAWRAHYQVKVMGHTLLALASLMLFALCVPLGGSLLQRNPALLMGEFPRGVFFTFLGYSIPALLPLVSLHTWLSMRVPGAWVALTIALAGSWVGVQLIGKGWYIALLPWGLAAQASIVFERWRVLPWGQIPLSTLVAVALAIWGLVDFSNRRETQA